MVSFSGLAGAASGQFMGASLGPGANDVYTYTASFGALVRATDTTLKRTSDGTTLYEQTRAYDAVGNVGNLTTTLPAGTDYQAFCYDEQNRLTWASSASGTVPCGGASWTAGSLTSGGLHQRVQL